MGRGCPQPTVERCHGYLPLLNHVGISPSLVPLLPREWGCARGSQLGGSPPQPLAAGSSGPAPVTKTNEATGRPAPTTGFDPEDWPASLAVHKGPGPERGDPEIGPTVRWTGFSVGYPRRLSIWSYHALCGFTPFSIGPYYAQPPPPLCVQSSQPHHHPSSSPEVSPTPFTGLWMYARSGGPRSTWWTGRAMGRRSAAGSPPRTLWTNPLSNSFGPLPLGRQESPLGGGVLSHPCTVASPLEGDTHPRAHSTNLFFYTGLHLR